jgi:hypothetical protein
MASIKIVDLAHGTAGFQPDVPGSQPGDPLVVDRGEGVTWDNRTNIRHWPWPIDAHGNLLSEAQAFACRMFLCDEIPADDVSAPIYSVNPDFSPSPPPPPAPLQSPVIKYVCRLHRQERGCIVLRNP